MCQIGDLILSFCIHHSSFCISTTAGPVWASGVRGGRAYFLSPPTGKKVIIEISQFPQVATINPNNVNTHTSPIFHHFTKHHIFSIATKRQKSCSSFMQPDFVLAINIHSQEMISMIAKEA
jgi:hypothetical protein